MATTMAGIRTKFTDDLGLPLIGGQVFTYDAGTSTPKDSYSDQLLTIPNTNPIILDDAGSCDLYLKGVYRLRVLDVNGVLMDERDNVSQADGQFDSVLANTIAIGELQTSVANFETRNVVKTDVDNKSIGYGLATSATVYSSLRSDLWRVAMPTGVDMGELIFTTYDTERTINGATVAAGAYFNPDLIAKESITGDKIAKATELNAPKFTATYATTTLETPNMVLASTGELKRSNDPLNAASRKVGKNAGNLAEYDAQKGLQTAHIQAGDGAPKIGFKKLVDTWVGGKRVAHGLDFNKILSITAMNFDNTSRYTPVNSQGWQVSIDATAVVLVGSFATINNRPVKILITYEL